MRALYEKRGNYTRGLAAQTPMEAFLADIQMTLVTLKEIAALPECDEPEAA